MDRTTGVPLATRTPGVERAQATRRAPAWILQGVTRIVWTSAEADEARCTEHQAVDGERRERAGLEPAHQEAGREVGRNTGDDDSHYHLTVNVGTGRSGQ